MMETLRCAPVECTVDGARSLEWIDPVVAKKNFDDFESPSRLERPHGLAGSSAESTPKLSSELIEHLAAGVSADAVETILAEAPGSIVALEAWVDRYQHLPEVTSVEIRIDDSNASDMVVPTAYVSIPDGTYIDFLTRETRWWLETQTSATGVIRPAIW